MAGVGLDHGQLSAGRQREIGDRRDRSRIDLDGDDLSGSARQQSAGQAARPRTDFENMAGVKIAGGSGDQGGQVAVEQEMLAKRVPRIQAMRRYDVSQRRGT